jgi:hypothetical protein
MSTSEYHAFYYWGEMPERFWDREIRKLSAEFVEDKITLQELEDSLWDMMWPAELRR